ncbi:sulfotransferase family protein [Salibacterium sp. K-3]
MNIKPFVVAGMPRSGTTLISRILDAHTNSVAPPDPYFGFFREFRNSLFEKHNLDCVEDEPLFDYFNGINKDKKHAILEGNLNIDIPTEKRDKVKKTIIGFAQTASPLAVPYIEQTNAGNFKELLIELYEALHKAYGNQDTTHVGFKTAWVEEFYLPFSRSLDDMKFINIIRDPRALIASRLKSTKHLRHDYPFDFLVKNWRKSAAYGLYNSNHYSDNVYTVKYEDLVSNTEYEVKKICEVLNLPFQKHMVDVRNFRDGKGNQWTNNSAYKETNSISQEFTDKWKTELSLKEVQYIEDLCEVEMKLLGYERVTNNNIQESAFYSPNTENHDSEWINKIHNIKDDRAKMEILKNYIANDDKFEDCNGELLEDLFLFQDFLKIK